MIRLVLFLLLASPLAGYGDSRGGVLSPVQEQQAQHIFTMVRCANCQGETIKESDAHLAKAMRHTIRQQLQSGQSEEQVIAFLRGRYGDYIILAPSLTVNTLALWLLPCMALLTGIFLIWRIKK